MVGETSSKASKPVISTSAWVDPLEPGKIDRRKSDSDPSLSSLQMGENSQKR